MSFVSLDQIKLEKRISWFDKKFDTACVDTQKLSISTFNKPDEIFIIDTLTHMLEYTCQDLQDHNETISSLDVCRIALYNTVEVLQSKLDIDIVKLKLDHMQIFQYITILLSKCQTNNFNIDYLTNKVINEKIEPTPAMTRSSDETIATNVERMVTDYHKSLEDIHIPEVYKPILVPVTTPKTRKRLAGIMRRH